MDGTRRSLGWLLVVALVAGGAPVRAVSRRVRAPSPAAPPKPPAADDTPPRPPELRVAAPAVRAATTVRPGARLRVTHHGAWLPARAARAVGRETWVATPDGVLRYGATLWTDPAHARPRGTLRVGAAVNDVAPAPGGALLATDRGLLRVTARGHAREVLGGVRALVLGDGHVGTARGLYRLGRVPSRVAGTAHLHVTALASCGGRRYAATHGHGVLALDGAPRPVRGLAPGRVAALACGDGGALLAATTTGVYAIHGERAAAVEGARRHATALLATARGVLVGTFGDGVSVLRGERPAARRATGRVTMLARGPTGALVGTDEGLAVLRDDGSAAAVPGTGAPQGMVTALALHGGALWAGTFEHGVGRLARGRWTRADVFDPRITALATGPDGGLWVGTARGLGRAEGGVVRRVADPRGWFARHVGALSVDGDALVVAVHPGAVAVRFDRDGARYEYYGARGWDAAPPDRKGLRWRDVPGSDVGPTVYGVARSREGLWWATDDGLRRLDARGVAALSALGGALPDDWLTDVRASGARVHALTLRGGLAVLDRGRVEVWPVPAMTATGTLRVAGAAALFGTLSSGLWVARRAGAGRVAFVTYGPRQGLSSGTVTAVALGRGALWVGGAAGVDRVAWDR